MRLHTREWGTSDRVAVLVHGMMGESRQFWQVGPALAERGYHVLAVDLPGHGLSPACTAGGLPAFAAALVDSVPQAPELVIGHSLGAIVAANGLAALRPERAVYVDVPFLPGSVDAVPSPEALREHFEHGRSDRTVARLRETRPWWSDEDRCVEAEAARLFDVATAVSLECDPATPLLLAPPDAAVPSLVVRADPSAFVSPQRAEQLRELGFEVRSVPGAGHSVWYGHFDAFLAALDGWV
jgi:pimeloyl-ACP methyl ester carboxylesterase